MRLSLMKAAHAAVGGIPCRKSGPWAEDDIFRLLSLAVELKAFVGLRPVFLGPGTLWRTWGTRPTLPVPVGFRFAFVFSRRLFAPVPVAEPPRLKPKENNPACAARLQSRAPPHEWISCYAASSTAACAAFIKESRMKLVEATKLGRKSGACGGSHHDPARLLGGT
jgi:hypothetical protein